MKVLKRLQYISTYERWMFVCVAIATLLRFMLIYFQWPFTDSDEGNMGVLALHVAYQGDHPIFFYGGNYLGPLEGYLAAPLFRLFGPSLIALRVPLVLCFTVFLLSMYYLVRMLYQSEKFALASVVLLGLGSPDVFFLQLRASGEYPEIEMCAAFMCLLALWLALSAHRSDQERWKRIAIYGLLGLTIGIAVWVDLLILPFVATAGLLLCFFCYRELLGWSGNSLVLGFAIGAFPMIYYNLTAPWDQNSLFVLMGLHNGTAGVMHAQHMTWLNQLTGTLIVALPMATGGSLHCLLSTIPPSGSLTSTSLPCVLVQSSWSTGYLVLWLIATCLAVYAIFKYRRYKVAHVTQSASSEERQEIEERQDLIRQCGRLMLLVSVGLTLVLFAISPISATNPDTAFRYLTCTLIAIPVLLWPAWRGLSVQKKSLYWWISLGLLLLVSATFVRATVRTFKELPTAQSVHQQQETVIQNLLHIGATRVYSDYWTCNILIFLSDEKVICSALDEQLNPGFDRYLPYHSIVQADPHPTYIFPRGSPQAAAMQQRVRSDSSHYRSYTFGNYLVYQPV